MKKKTPPGMLPCSYLHNCALAIRQLALEWRGGQHTAGDSNQQGDQANQLVEI